MAIGPDGRIIRKHNIRRKIRQVTPINTDNPSSDIGFIGGFIAVFVITIVVVLIFAALGWLGDLIFNLSWWNAKVFTIVGAILNFLLFPAYISGALEGLAISSYWKYKLYAFLYGFLILSIPFGIKAIFTSDYNYWNFLWAVAYGIFSLVGAVKMSG